MRGSRLFAAFAILIGAWMRPSEAMACKCEPISTAAKLAAADVVFEGRLVAMTRIRVDQDVQHVLGPDGLLAEIDVEKVWKGSPGSRVSVLTIFGSCAFHFGGLGSRSIVAARQVGAYLETGGCSGLTEPDEARALLGAPRLTYRPDQQNEEWYRSPAAPPDPPPHQRGLDIGVGFLIGAATLTFALARRARRR